MVIHAVDYSRKDGVFATSELNFFLGKNFLVTYHDGPMRSVSLTEERACKGTMHIARAPDRVAHKLLDAHRGQLQAGAGGAVAGDRRTGTARRCRIRRKETLNKILQVKKEVLHLRQIIGPQREVLARFARGEFKLIRPHIGAVLPECL